MSRAFADITFTPSVKAAQTHYRTRGANEGYEGADDRQNELTEYEREFIQQSDGFYQATVNEAGWPYVQFRGGPRGFLRVISPRLIGFADFRGNLQYLSVGNINATGRIALILLDQATRRRLKIWGRARVVDDPAQSAALVVPKYTARVERAIMIDVEAFDWNCPQHITRRFTETEIRQMISPLSEELDRLRTQVARGQTPQTTDASQVLGAGPLKLQVTGVRMLTPTVRAYELRAAEGGPLPAVSPGAHLPVPVRASDGKFQTRNYSIASDADDSTRWEIAVLREDAGEGGSAFIHDSYAVGGLLDCELPENNFELHSDARPAILVGSGIGIAPLKSMAHELKREGRAFEIHFSAYSPTAAPYLAELQLEFASKLHTHWSGPSSTSPLDLGALVATQPVDSVFYVCGSDQMIAQMQLAAETRGLDAGVIRFERFAAPPALNDDRVFEIAVD